MAQYTQISITERRQLTHLLYKKNSVESMAVALGRHRSSIYREIKRNTVKNIYDPQTAEKLTQNRRAGGAKCKFEIYPEIKKYVLEKLRLDWSPEQISGRMKKENQNFYVSPETIYHFIYQDKMQNLYKLLPSKKKKRRHRHQRKSYKIGAKSENIAARNIKNRPLEALSREHDGHWEGDTIRFPKTQKSCVTTLIERKSRYTELTRNKDGKTKTVIDGINATIKKYPQNTWKTITFDQGSEFMGFRRIEHFSACSTYFCDPHSPWQRPTNENTNGRIRRFLPKNFPIDDISQADLDVISERMNNTPRKCLGYLTPKEVFMRPHCRT
jgi:IS30 family transposase